MEKLAHIKVECTEPDCGGTCNACCLFMCKVCGGAEGSLPTDCPGRQLTGHESDMIYQGYWDFRAEKDGWAFPDGTGTSMGDSEVLLRKHLG